MFFVLLLFHSIRSPIIVANMTFDVEKVLSKIDNGEKAALLSGMSLFLLHLPFSQPILVFFFLDLLSRNVPKVVLLA